MRTTLLATASSALAAAALLAGAGTAGADEAETDGPVCIVVDTEAAVGEILTGSIGSLGEAF